MGFEAWLTIFVLGLVIAALMSNRMGMDIALLSGLIILMVGGSSMSMTSPRASHRKRSS